MIQSRTQERKSNHGSKSEINFRSWIPSNGKLLIELGSASVISLYLQQKSGGNAEVRVPNPTI